MNAKTATLTATLVLALAGGFLAGCSAATAEAPSPTSTATAEPTATEAPAPAETTAPEEVPAPVVGDTVAAAEVAALRESGLAVYVSPNGAGDGLVVDPVAPLPEVVISDIETHSDPHAPADIDEFGVRGAAEDAQSTEMEAAGLSTLFIVRTGSYGPDGALTGSGYVVASMNVANARAFFTAAGDTRSDTRSGAIANAQGLIDSNPGIALIDLTD